MLRSCHLPDSEYTVMPFDGMGGGGGGGGWDGDWGVEEKHL